MLHFMVQIELQYLILPPSTSFIQYKSRAHIMSAVILLSVLHITFVQIYSLSHLNGMNMMFNVQ